MAKITLLETGSGYYANNPALEAAIENTLSRDGTAPNQMGANLDMNSNRVTNLTDGVNPQDAASVSQLEGIFAAGNLDGNKGDITVASGASSFEINAGAVTTAELGGDITVAGKALLDDTDAAAQRATLGLGTAAQQATADFAPAAHTHSASQISDYTEVFQDTLGTYLVAGTGITVTYDDTSGQTTIVNTGIPGPQGDPGATDHGLLTGLSDDDHPQYLLKNDILSSDVNGINILSGKWAAFLSADNLSYSTLTYNVAGLAINGVAVSLAGHTHAYLPLAGGTLTGSVDFGTFLRLRSSDGKVFPLADNGTDLGGGGNRFANVYAANIFYGAGVNLATTLAGKSDTGHTHSYLSDAPSDGSTYGRLNGAWSIVAAGVTDHGALTGLADDDHPQYPLAAGAETISGGWNFTTAPTINATAISLAGHAHAASDITSGTLAVAQGGTNIGSYTAGNYLNALNATTLQQRTPAQVLSDIGAAAASHAHAATDITSGTLAVARGGTGTTTSTGTGSAVLSASPTLTGTAVVAAIQTSGNIELGHASDTSLARIAAGRMSIEGVEVGYRQVPRSTTATTAAVGDVGKCIAITAGITIPNATFAAGDALSIYNDSAGSLTITQGASFTLRLVGTATTGNRTLAQRGMATIWFNSATEAVITGGGLT